jgi:glycosyltransferase involved in cell wall biosynthesis
VSERIAIVAPFKQWGGIERKIVTLCNEFLRLGCDVSILLVRGGVTPYPELLSPEVSIHDLKTHSRLSSVIALRRWFDDNNPDVVITAKDHAAQASIIARWLARGRFLLAVKVTNTLSKTIRRPIQRWLIRSVYPFADRIIANSQGVADDLHVNFNIPSNLIGLINNPTITQDFAARTGLPVSHPWFFPRQGTLIVAAGRLVPQKDFASLIQAFHQLHKVNPTLRLVIFGEGGERSALERLIHEKELDEAVDLPGFVADPVPYMALADLFVLSSRYEGLPNVLIEAMAAGCPVVATDCPSGPREILVDGKLGPLVPVGDVDALATAMAWRLSQPRDKLALQAATSRFDSAHVAADYLKTLLPNRA